MNKVIDISGFLIPLSSITYIVKHEERKIEYIGDKGKMWFPMCLFKQETWNGEPVFYTPMGNRYVVEDGYTVYMRLHLINGKYINALYDESIVNEWKQYKTSTNE